MKKNIYVYSNLLAWGLVLFLIGNYAFGWTTPSLDPPAGNITPSFSQWTTSGSNIYYNTGNVGIGVTGPNQKLEIAGVSTYRGLYMHAATGRPTITLGNDDGASNLKLSYIQAQDGNLMFGRLNDDWGGHSEKVRITSGGNVGIGTTSPGQKLSVSGNIDVMSNKIVNLATPTAATDAATKGYVDALGPSGYTFCYASNTEGTVTCDVGYEKVITSAGNGCTPTSVPDSLWSIGSGPCLVKMWTTPINKYCNNVNTNTGNTFECLSLTSPAGSIFLEQRCFRANNNYLSDIALCCK